jgi:hypothetical protein
MEAAGCSETLALMYQTMRRVKIKVEDYPEDGGRTFLRNVGELPHYITSHC